MAIVLQISLLGIILLALLIALRSSYSMKNKKELGVRGARPIYSDEKGTKLLKAEQLQLQGKPDYIFETWFLKKLIPLEIKSGILKEDVPHLGDLYQLAAYFLIIKEVYGKKPPYGKLVYANKTFKIKNTYRLRKQVLKTLKEMRGMLEEARWPQAEPSFVKCKHCVCKMTVCEWNEEGLDNETR